MRRIFLFSLGLLLALAAGIAVLPLGWVTTRYLPGLEATSVSGTIWDGRIRGARYQGLPVGDVDAALQVRPLLRGEAEIAFQRLGEPLSGNATLSRGLRRVTDVTGTITFPAPLGGSAVVLALDRVALETNAQGSCRAVSGTVTATLGGLPVIGSVPPLEGQLRCDGDAFHAPLALADRSVGLDARLWPTGSWQADLAIRNRNPLVLGLLELAGFGRTAEGVALRMAGTAVAPSAGLSP
ncbi:MAG: type II secretion system protein N [Sandaracinobacteroides sp.]